MAKDDYVRVMENAREARRMVTVYTPSKKKERDVCPNMDYEQSITLKKKDFPSVLSLKIGGIVRLITEGPVTRLDKEGVSIGVHKVKLEKE